MLFEVVSLLKYLSPFMFNRSCFAFFFFFSGRRRWKHRSYRDPSKCTKVCKTTTKNKKSSRASRTGWNPAGRRLQWVKGAKWQTGPDGAHTLPWNGIWSTDCVFCSSNELYSMCVTCQDLICMLDELVNCSQCTFPESHGSSWFGFI